MTNVKINVVFLSFKLQLPPSYETETAEHISMLLIIYASSNYINAAIIYSQHASQFCHKFWHMRISSTA